MPVVEARTVPDRGPRFAARSRALLDQAADLARRHPWRAVLALAVVAALLGRAPLMALPLSPDEGGLLMVGSQWSPGDSVYGDYWVDRPPVLIAIAALADLLGGAWGLRAIGILAVVASVLLAGVLGRVVAPQLRTAALLPAATAALLLATPLFGAAVVDAEVLGVPLLLAGMVAAVAASRADGSRTALRWGLAAGAAGAGAALTKQNLLDVFVLVLALLVVGGLSRRGDDLRRLVASALGTAVGAGIVVGGAVAAAASLGTSPGELWAAVVTFRGEAAPVLLESPHSGHRLQMMLLALLGSGAPFLVGVLLLRRRDGSDRAAADLRWAAVAVLVWEATSVLLGGSYWLHYLTALVPGLVLLAAVSGQRDGMVGSTPERSRRPLTLAYGYAALSTLCVIGWVAVNPPDRSSPEAVAAYLEARAEPGDTGVVAFGVPSILQAAGLESPYPDLWSLPVRVHDPDLRAFAALLAGPDRPTWLVVAGTSLWTWGIDPSAAQPYVDAHYEHVDDVAGYTIYRESEQAP